MGAASASVRHTLAQLPSYHHKNSSSKHARSGTMSRAHGEWIQVVPGTIATAGRDPQRRRRDQATLKRAKVERPNTSELWSVEAGVDLVNEEFVVNGRTILE